MVSFETLVSYLVQQWLFCSRHSLFVLSLNTVKSTADLFDDDEEGDLFKEKPAIPAVVAGTAKETESHRETVMEKKVMVYKWIVWLRFQEEVTTAAEVDFPCTTLWKCHICETALGSWGLP